MREDFLRYYNMPRKAQTHKGDYGKVFIIAGCEGMTGAAMLCTEASIRTGAGLVYLFSPGKILPIYEIGCKEAVKIKVGNDEDAFFKENHIRQILESIKSSADKAVVVIGPGMGREPETQKFIRVITEEILQQQIPIILDADGLNAYRNSKIPRGLILTPHVAELSRISDFKIEYIINNMVESATRASNMFDSILVLKGNRSVVAQNNQFFINETGNPAMATGGSGDVLAGILAGIIATSNNDSKSKSIFELVCIGVFIHGLCGDIGAKHYGERALKAGDLIEMLKEVHLYDN